MKMRPALTLLYLLLLSVAAGGLAAAAPPAPTPLAPADGANVLAPFTISWSAVSDPSGIAGYNWQVSPSSSFATVTLQNSTRPETTQATVSGLTNGTYFWRVNAASAVFEQGVSAWSQTRSFNITGVAPGALGTPTLLAFPSYSTFHPMEAFPVRWTAVPGAVSYRLEASNDSSFPLGTVPPGVHTLWIDNIPGTSDGFKFHDSLQGNWFARVFAVDADNPEGTRSLPSNVITFSVFYNNPVGPPPSPVSPADGATLSLPITLTWADVPYPQDLGYEVQVSSNSSFSTLEGDTVPRTAPSYPLLSLTPGTKFWRVRSHQGDASPTTSAVTAWSAVRTFTVLSAPPTPASVTLAKAPLYSGEETSVSVQLTAAAPAGGATISLTSSNPAAVSVPATITMPGNTAVMGFTIQAGQVTASTPVTITATLNSGSASVQFTVLPPSLKSISTPSTVTGGTQVGAIVALNGQAPPSGAVVSLSSDSPAASPPPSATVAPGAFSASVTISTSAVMTSTLVTITASWNGVSVQSGITLTPQQPPASLTLDPTSTVGTGGSSFGTVTVTSPPSTDLILPVTSSHPAIARVNSSVMIPAGATTGGFNIFTTAVAAQTVVTISVSGGGVTRSATLTVNPESPPTPGTPTLSSPAADATPSQPVTFDWTDVTAATSYTIAIDDQSTFTAPLVVSQNVTVSQATIGGLPAQRLWWRVRGVNSAGVAGPWSASRRFTPQSAPAALTLSSLSLSPTSVVGGNTSQGTVTLSSAAPSGGAVVTLSSGNTNIATVLTSVTVAAGSSSATFTVTTMSVAATNSVVISALFSGITRTATLTVTPPPPAASLSSLTLNPTSVTGGNASQGTVSLTSAAPSGGAVVTLTSSNTAVATVLASVTVAAGATSANFTVTTKVVSATSTVSLTAAYSTVTKSATLTVNPASTGALPAPTLSSPAADARFAGGVAITFDWSDVAGAASYTLQIDDDSTFPTPQIVNQTVTGSSQFATSTLPVTRMWWRVRANDAAGNPGAWSSARRIEVR